MRGGLNGFLSTGVFTRKQRSVSRSSSKTSLQSFKIPKTSGLRSQRNKNKFIENDEDNDYYDHSDINKSKKINISTSISRFSRERPISKQQSRIHYSDNKPQSAQFLASKRELKTYITQLSSKIKVELNNVLASLDLFNRNIKRTVESQYQKIQQQIVQLVQEYTRQSQQTVLKIVRQKTSTLNSEIISAKEELQSMYEMLKQYQQELDSSNWKKAMGQIVGSGLQQKVQQLIERSQKIRNLKSFKLCLNQNKLSIFENSLLNMLEVDVIVDKHRTQAKKRYISAQ